MGRVCALDTDWLAHAKQAIEALAAIYGFEEIDVHPGPTTAVRSINASWKTSGTSYISLALPDDEAHPHEYSNALARMLYGA
jgi:hypothetical protein